LAFRSVTSSIQNKRDQIRRILQLPPPATTPEDKEITKQDQVYIKLSIPQITAFLHYTMHFQENQEGSGATPIMNLDQASRDMEDAVTSYLRRATETFDLSKNVEVNKFPFTFYNFKTESLPQISFI